MARATGPRRAADCDAEAVVVVLDDPLLLLLHALAVSAIITVRPAHAVSRAGIDRNHTD